MLFFNQQNNENTDTIFSLAAEERENVCVRIISIVA